MQKSNQFLFTTPCIVKLVKTNDLMSGDFYFFSPTLDLQLDIKTLQTATQCSIHLIL